MIRSLFSLYIRAGIGVANLTLRVAARGADLAADAVRMAVPSSGRSVHSASEDVFGQPAQPTPEPVEATAQPVESTAEPVEPTLQPVPELGPDQATPQPLDEARERAKTVEDKPELVAEVAEPGAEDGAGAALEVDEPWEGYDDLKADEVTTRIGSSDAAELAVVELYERSHKQRRTVLTAAERRQRELANAPS